MFTLTFNLKGLTCEACVKLSKKRLMKIEGVKDASVDLNGEVSVSSDIKISLDDVRDTLKDTSYVVS